MLTITFDRQQHTVSIKAGTDLLSLSYLDATLPLRFGCCQGTCGTCAIKMISGEENLSPKTRQEKETLCRLKLNSHRLACQCAVKQGDIIIDL